MEKYLINYNTGAGNQEVEVTDLVEAKNIALDGMNYTSQDVVIETLDGEEVARSRWIGVAPEGEEQDFVLTQFGSYGYYQIWSDELENM